MTDPAFTILYVDSAAESAGFYQALLGRPPVESSETFAMFLSADRSHPVLGLWSRHTVAPAATPVGGTELLFALADRAAVDARHAAIHGGGVAIAQAPTAMDFGYTFVALDPDGHRLRFYVPEPGA